MTQNANGRVLLIHSSQDWSSDKILPLVYPNIASTFCTLEVLIAISDKPDRSTNGLSLGRAAIFLDVEDFTLGNPSLTYLSTTAANSVSTPGVKDFFCLKLNAVVDDDRRRGRTGLALHSYTPHVSLHTLRFGALRGAWIEWVYNKLRTPPKEDSMVKTHCEYWYWGGRNGRWKNGCWKNGDGGDILRWRYSFQEVTIDQRH